MNIDIRSATVVRGVGADHVFIVTGLTEATFPYTRRLHLMFEAAAGEGAAYVKEHFGIDPEVVRMPSGKRKTDSSSPPAPKKKKRKKRRKD